MRTKKNSPLISEELARKFEQNVSAKEKARLKRDNRAAFKILLKSIAEDDPEGLAEFFSKLEPERILRVMIKFLDDPERSDIFCIISNALSDEQRAEAVKLVMHSTK